MNSKPHWNYSVPNVAMRPELPVLVMLDAALEATIVSLASGHPELDGFEPETLYTAESHIAQTVITMSKGLQELLDAYHAAISGQQTRYGSAQKTVEQPEDDSF